MKPATKCSSENKADDSADAKNLPVFPAGFLDRFDVVSVIGRRAGFLSNGAQAHVPNLLLLRAKQTGQVFVGKLFTVHSPTLLLGGDTTQRVQALAQRETQVMLRAHELKTRGVVACIPELCGRILRSESPQQSAPASSSSLTAPSSRTGPSLFVDFMLAMEYCDGGNLEAEVLRWDGHCPLTAQELARLAVCLLQALEDLHQAGIAHGDVASRNILIHRGSDARTWKLCDLELARRVGGQTDGPLHEWSDREPDADKRDAYAAPELLAREEVVDYSKADVYSAAMLLIEVISGKRLSQHPCDQHPFVTHAALMNRFSPELTAIIRNMLRKSPEERPTARQCLDRLVAFLDDNKSIHQSSDRNGRPAMDSKKTPNAKHHKTASIGDRKAERKAKRKATEAFGQEDTPPAMLPAVALVVPRDMVDEWWALLRDLKGYFAPDLSSPASDHENAQYTRGLVKLAIDAVRLAGLEFAEEATFDCDNLTNILACTDWADKLSSDHVRQLFFILTGGSRGDVGDQKKGDRSSISATDLLQTFVWLGDPKLTADECIPAHLSIAFHHHFLTNNSHARAMFKGFECRWRAGLTKDPVLRLNEGRMRLPDEPGGPVRYFHRNLVLTDPLEPTFPHKLMWAFDAKSNEIVESNNDLRKDYRRRRIDHPHHQQHALLSFAQTLSNFNSGCSEMQLESGM